MKNDDLTKYNRRHLIHYIADKIDVDVWYTLKIP